MVLAVNTCHSVIKDELGGAKQIASWRKSDVTLQK